MIELTEEQRQAVKNGEAVRLPSAEIGEDVVLLRATQYEKIRELLEDEREQRAVPGRPRGRAHPIAELVARDERFQPGADLRLLLRRQGRRPEGRERPRLGLPADAEGATS